MSAIDRFDCSFFLSRNGLSDGKFVSFTNNDNGAFPANIRLDEDVLKTSSVFVFRRRLQDVFIKTNLFALLIFLQDVLIKTNIFVLVICLQGIFKTFSKRLQDVSRKRLQEVFKTSSRRLAKTSSRHLAKTSSKHLQYVFKTF